MSEDEDKNISEYLGRTLLYKLEDARIFKIDKEGEIFVIWECNGWYFNVEMTRDQLRELAHEILALTAEVDETGSQPPQ